jgi:hypothetical protein
MSIYFQLSNYEEMENNNLEVGGTLLFRTKDTIIGGLEQLQL